MVSSNTTFSNVTGLQSSQQLQPNFLAQCLPIAILIVITNSIVFVLFGRKSSLRTPANFFLLSLAICDFLNGTVNIPLFLATELNQAQPFPTFVYVAVPAIQHFTVVLTSYHILAITGEKYLAVTMPFRRRVFVTCRMVAGCVGAIWAISAVFLVVHLILEPFSEDMFKYDIISVILTFIIPFLIMIYAYGVMIFTLRKRRSMFIERQNTGEKKQIRSDTRCLIIFITMLAIFVICWCPWFIFKILAAKLYNLVLSHAINVYIVVRYLSSAINPILYTLFKNDFYKALKSCLRTSRKDNDKRYHDITQATLIRCDRRSGKSSTRL